MNALDAILDSSRGNTEGEIFKYQSHLSISVQFRSLVISFDSLPGCCSSETHNTLLILLDIPIINHDWSKNLYQNILINLLPWSLFETVWKFALGGLKKFYFLTTQYKRSVNNKREQPSSSTSSIKQTAKGLVIFPWFYLPLLFYTKTSVPIDVPEAKALLPVSGRAGVGRFCIPEHSKPHTEQHSCSRPSSSSSTEETPSLNILCPATHTFLFPDTPQQNIISNDIPLL